MSFFVRIKGCVNFRPTTSVHKNAYSCAASFSHWERFLKTTASLSNLIPPCFYNPANNGRFSVCFLSPGVSYPPVYTVVLVFLGGALTGPYPTLRFGGACGRGVGAF